MNENRYKSLNLRSIDADLFWRIKVAAANSGKTLKDWCVSALEKELAK